MSPAELDAQLKKARESLQFNRFTEALDLYVPLVQHTTHPAIWFEYSRAASGSGDFELADQIWGQMISRDPGNPALLSALAREYAGISLFDKAGELFAKAANLEPGNINAQISLASHLTRANSVADARGTVNKCLELDPSNEWARYLSSHLDRRENKFEEAEKNFRDLLAASPKDQKLASASHLELARIYDLTGRFDEAMTELKEAKRLAAPTLPIEMQRKFFDQRREHLLRTTKSLPKSIFDTWNTTFPPDARSPAPPLAFLGGHLRSGTTLLERILDAHPRVAAYDEPLAFQTVAPFVDITAPIMPGAALNSMRQRYLKNMTKDSGPPEDGKVLVDKNPGATAFIPALLRIFPEMRILLALRDPRDVMVSSFFILPTHYMHLSLDRLAQNYSCVMDVWLAVRDWHGVNWMETRYEDVVADLQKEGSRVTQFLGLDWDANQARFHENNRKKAVKNYNEVTKPVYTKAIGRWQAYEKYLTPILPVLEPYCREFGYA